LDFYSTAFELIDMRSFSNLWFWITLAYAWSAASHYVIGVPFVVLARAVRYGGQAEADLKELVRINASRFTYIADTAGSWLVAFVRCARQIDHTSLPHIRTSLKRQRLAIQIIGMISILATSMWGMFHNLSTGVLGG